LSVFSSIATLASLSPPNQNATNLSQPSTEALPLLAVSPATTTAASTTTTAAEDNDPDSIRAQEFLSLRQVEVEQAELATKRAAVERVLRRINGELSEPAEEKEEEAEEEEEDEEEESVWGSSNGGGGVRMAGAWGR